MGNHTSQQPGKAFRTTTVKQRGVEIYLFNLSADDLVKYSTVERFGESSDGVNRKYDERHALAIAEAMLDPNTVMLDSICGDLRGDWQLDRGRLIAGPGAYISIDDGQHRRGACEVLNPEERLRWSFPVVATKGLDYETRLNIFRQQKKRKPIDSRLDLAQRHKLDDWKTDAEREAYNLVLRLNSDAASPLRGMIIIDETVKRPYENKHQTVGINANGLWSTLRSVMGKGSPLYALSLEKRSEVALNMIFVASEVWVKSWKSDAHMLTTARGINAVLSLIVSGSNFRIKIGDDFRIESLREALMLGSRFNWTTRANKNRGVREITGLLDDAIGRSHQRKLEQGSSEILA